jgi:hypothetical protein
MAAKLSRGQLAYWHAKLGAGATAGQIAHARAQQLANGPSTAADPTGVGGGPTPTSPAPAAPASLPFVNTTAANNAAAQSNFNIQDLGPGGFQDQLTQLQFGYSDPTNPFNVQTVMKQAYDNRVRGTANSMAARGQLYAGATQNAQNANTRDFQQRSAAALQRFNQAVASIKGREQLARQQVTNTANTGAASQLDAALQGGS